MTTVDINRKFGDPYAAVWISLSRVERISNIEFPKLPEVLA